MFASVKTLNDLFEVKLPGLCDAEQPLGPALPQLAAKARAQRPRLSPEKHPLEAKNQVARLKQVATSLDLRRKGPGCKAMEGLVVAEGQQMMALQASHEVPEAALLSAAQGAEHYELA